MRTAALAACLAAASLLPAQADLTGLLAAVEKRYNRAQTLQVKFEQVYTSPGRPRRLESGDLYLRKPGRMRWEYRSPAGKLFLSDGKDVYFYTPASNRVEKSRLKETEDMRAPLAFLLGRLEFRRDFDKYVVTREGKQIRIRAFPKSDKLPYTQVEFLVNPAGEIRHLIVTGQDRSVLEFRFEGERLNPRLEETLFRFHMPAGAELVEAADR